jgi:cytochrome c oxidase cbb3-type subunit 3
MSAETREIAERARADAAARDGIGEEDHPIPLWFNVGFWGLLAFGVAYIVYYTLVSDWSQLGQYEAARAAAQERAQAAQASLPAHNPFRGDAAALAEGQQVFAANCAACHKPDGSGLVGPSLVDPYWKYGNSDEELFRTVSEGRPAGMPPWGPVLGSEKIWKVLGFVESLPKTDAPGVGAPDLAGGG